MIETNFRTAPAIPASFPDTNSSAPLQTKSSAPETSQVAGKAKRILVIDDEENIADSLAKILDRHGYNATAFYDGQSAINSARSQCPDIVVSDVIMPKLHGVDTVLAIRKLCPGARIVLFSGQAGSVNILEKARSEGYEFELLPKPIHPDQLLKRLFGSIS